jgi:hypothetical protein
VWVKRLALSGSAGTRKSGDVLLKRECNGEYMEG